MRVRTNPNGNSRTARWVSSPSTQFGDFSNLERMLSTPSKPRIFAIRTDAVPDLTFDGTAMLAVPLWNDDGV